MANILDSMINLLSPSAGVEREASRQALAQLKKMGAQNSYYEGTSAGRRGAQNVRDNSARNITRSELVKARRIARDFYRNNSIHKAACDAIAYNTVSSGIRPRLETIGRSAPKRQQAAQRVFNTWAESIHLDVDGQHNLYGIQFQTMLELVKSGECLIVRKRTLEPISGVQLQLKVLSGDYLDHMKDGVFDGRRVIQGVEYDDNDAVVAYWLFPNHPSEVGGFFSRHKNTSVRHDAEGVIHLFDCREPGQNRGLPWGMASFNRLRNLDSFQDARLELMKIASCMVGAVKTMGGVGNATGDPLPDRAEPGLILRLGSNQEMNFNTPPNVNGQSDFVREELRTIASDFGITYEELTGDLTGVNFSSGRLGFNGMHCKIGNHRQRILIPHLCQRVWQWYSEVQALAGNPLDAMRCKWIEPPREMFDPTREVPPMIALIRAGLKSMQDALAELGENPEQQLLQISEWNTWLDQFGITLDTDPRKVSGAGNINPEATTQGEAANKTGMTDE